MKEIEEFVDVVVRGELEDVVEREFEKRYMGVVAGILGEEYEN